MWTTDGIWDMTDLEVIYEIRQRKTNSISFHLYVESEQTKQDKNGLTETEIKGMIARGDGVAGGVGEKGDGESSR